MATSRPKRPNGSPNDSSPRGSSTRLPSRPPPRGAKCLRQLPPPHLNRRRIRRHWGRRRPRCSRPRSFRFQAPLKRSQRSLLRPRPFSRQRRLPRWRPLRLGLHLTRRQARVRAAGLPQERSTLARSLASPPPPHPPATRLHPAPPPDRRPTLMPWPSPRPRRTVPKRAQGARAPFPQSS